MPCNQNKFSTYKWPKKGKKFPAVIVIHENRGLVPHIQDVTRRMAGEGFLALAPDALSPVGGTPEDTTNVRDLFGKLNNEELKRKIINLLKGEGDDNAK